MTFITKIDELNQKIKEIIPELLQEDDYATELEAIQKAGACIKGLNYLGNGSSRIVYKYKDNVIKIAFNEFGEEQNKQEFNTYKKLIKNSEEKYYGEIKYIGSFLDKKNHVLVMKYYPLLIDFYINKYQTIYTNDTNLDLARYTKIIKEIKPSRPLFESHFKNALLDRLETIKNIKELNEIFTKDYKINKKYFQYFNWRNQINQSIKKNRPKKLITTKEEFNIGNIGYNNNQIIMIDYGIDSQFEISNFDYEKTKPYLIKDN